MATRNDSLLIKTALVLAIIGAINWGLVGFFNFNLVDAILGGGSREQTSALARVIYAVVGLAGLVTAIFLGRLRVGGVAGERIAPGGPRTPVRP